jgi:signal transduction histidine kinase
VPVDLDVDGERPERVPDAVSLAAFRIVQESLTNARRHATGAAVRIGLAFDGAGLTVVVENGAATGPHGNGAPPGVGIMGMRERAVTVGGTLDAGPVTSGFRVLARLPCARA